MYTYKHKHINGTAERGICNMIAELLDTGQQNAKPGRKLADILNVSVRDVAEQIQIERRAGVPICASSNARQPGYYLAESNEEIQTQVDRLRKRAGELYKTRRALIKAMRKE